VDDATAGDRPVCVDVYTHQVGQREKLTEKEKPLALAKLRQYLALARDAIKPMPIADALVMDYRFGRSTSG
jgi:hypothetical protein